MPAAASGAISFSPTSIISSTAKMSIQDALGKYLSYLKGLGFQVNLNVEVDIVDEPDWPYAQYFPSRNRMVIGSIIASDVDIARSSITDSILDPNGANVRRDTASHAINPQAVFLQDGVAEYFVASYANRADIGSAAAAAAAAAKHLKTPYVRTLARQRQFNELQRKDFDVNSEVGIGDTWGSLFWAIRSVLSSSVADRVVARAWQKLSWPIPDDQVAAAYLNAMFGELQTSSTVPDIAKVKAILRSNGFPTD